MITDDEIQKIFDWADKNRVVGKSWKQYKWGIDLVGDEINSVKKGIPRDKDTFLKITHLNLEKYKLSDIPVELFKLTKLQYLNISGNKLETLPKEIGNLENLEVLDLSYNGTWSEKGDCSIMEIPSEIKNFQKLRYLDLSGIKLDDFPKEIWELKSLKALHLDCYKKTLNIPKEIGSLKNLKNLTLCDLSNTELPSELENLVNLEYLKIENCTKLKNISKEIGNLTKLTTLELGRNSSLLNLPSEISNLLNLEYLEVSSCRKLKTIPKEIGNLINLKKLQFNHLDITELPSEIGNLVNLESLEIYVCHKLKTIPKEIGNLIKLTNLNVSWNNNLIELPRELGNLINLTHLNFSGSGLKELPSELANLKKLKFLNDEPYVVLRKENEGTSLMIRDERIVKFTNLSFGNSTFPHKNILLKGVPGTGKSRAIENIINKKLGLEEHKENVLRVNIHSASSNADLMQGIGISSKDGQIEYKEKQGLILNLIQRATFNPNQPFVLVLEEIQENSLNELIGDLIYLIEESKRAENLVADDEEYSYEALVEKIIADNSQTDYVEIPYLVNESTAYRKMIMPHNLYIFCTSNYRDDKKVIEDNLLRRFEVLEIYPKVDVVSDYCKDFFSQLNENILEVMKDEIHPDRFLIGHSNWIDVKTDEAFYRAFLKVVVEFKDIKEVEFSDFKEIVEKLPLVEELNFNSYKDLIEDLQSKAGYDFLD